MKKILFALIPFTAFSIPALADDDQHPNPVEEPVEFVGNTIENTASTVVGAVAGTVKSLGDMASSADTEENDKRD